MDVKLCGVGVDPQLVLQACRVQGGGHEFDENMVVLKQADDSKGGRQKAKVTDPTLTSAQLPQPPVQRSSPE